MQLTVFFDGQFWIGIIEYTTDDTYQACRYIFGSEPNTSRIIEFVNTEMMIVCCNSGDVYDNQDYIYKKCNPKRMKRLVAKELNKRSISTKAQQTISKNRELNKIEKKNTYRSKREERKEDIRLKKRQKNKEKRKGR